MTQTWRKELREWAEQVALDVGSRDGVMGTAIGGSLARGQEWRHSDLELGVLVEQRDAGLPYFNIRAGRGVEMIQLVRGELEEQVRQVEGGDLAPVLGWPIQLWQCRVVKDPTGILARFKQQFDSGLFQQEVIDRKITIQREHIDKTLGEARQLLSAGKPRQALCRARYAMNEAILAQYWQLGELPRSQNRTDSRLRWLCRKHSCMPFYELYRSVFSLDETSGAVRKSWPQVRDQVLEITRLWGDSARDFFLYAVDSNFAWRQNAGILTVYRLYIPIIGGAEQGIAEKLDDTDWAEIRKSLIAFLGLSCADPVTVGGLIDRVDEACRRFGRG